MYTEIKSLHMTLAATSGILFAVRAVWALRGSTWLQKAWVKAVPHLVDSLLLIMGVTLMIILRAWPYQTPWLAAKLTALVLYIGLGSMAIKHAETVGARLVFTLLALLVFAYMVSVAVTKNPLPFFS